MTIASATSTPPLTLATALWPSRPAAGGGLTYHPALRVAALMLFGSLALYVSAKIQVPMWPVPITMQTFVVLALGLAYGWRLGGATVLLYLGYGAAGLPVFAQGGGLQYLVAGPTAGYLAGFAVAATLVGFLAERGWGRSPLSAAAAMVIGNVALYACGLAWLGSLVGYDRAVELGLLPFLFGDALKVGLGTALLPLAWRLVRRRG